MKIGDQFPVRIGEHDVAAAYIENIEEGVATVVIPATRVQFGVASYLTSLDPEVDRGFIEEVEKPSEQVEQSPAPVDEKAPVEDSNQSLRSMELDSSELD